MNSIRLLFLCSGNTCRSAMAEHLFRKLIKDSDLDCAVCDSAGFFAHNGDKISNNALCVLKSEGLDASSHCAKELSSVCLSNYDVFVVMNDEQKGFLLGLGVNSVKVYILNEKLGGIPDPFGGDLDAYKKTKDKIKFSLNDLLVFVEKVFEVKNSSIVFADSLLLEQLYEVEQASYSDPWSRESIQSEVVDTNSRFFAFLSHRGVVLGYACMKLFCDTADIVKLTTHPDFRRLGVAGLLLDHIINYSKKLQLKKLFLEVRESNSSAISLYESFGFDRICLRKNFYQIPIESAVSMVKML